MRINWLSLISIVIVILKALLEFLGDAPPKQPANPPPDQPD